jgi:ribonuclease BN (tRNA processing enzyme)
VHVQVLGSGGPEADDGRVSASYLVWQDGQARLLVDMGSGSFSGFERSGAQVKTLDALLFSHFHVDHANDLPALVKASWFIERSRDLPLFGPAGNDRMPGAQEFTAALFGAGGAYRYLGDFLDGRAAFRLLPEAIPADGGDRQVALERDDLRAEAVPVNHGPIPALAWRIELGGKSLVFSGDMSGRNQTLAGLAQGADLMVAHHAIPEGTEGIARNLHMPPSVIGAIAGEAAVSQVVLSHRMNRSLGREPESLEHIRRHYSGPVHFAEDGQCFTP